MEKTESSTAWHLLMSGLKIVPLVLLVLLLAYVFNSSAKQMIDRLILQTPAKGLVSNEFEEYPRFLNSGDIVIKKAVFNDSGKEVNGIILEIRKPVAIGQTPTVSMRPMFGNGNLLVQEVLDRNTVLNVGDIVVYQNNNDLIIHQIIGEKDGCFITKGLNNPAPDGVCVTRDSVKYRLLFAIPTKNP